MKYNHKNRPRPYSTRKNPTKDEVTWFRWAKGQEKELREMKPSDYDYCLRDGIRFMKKEILGE